MSEKLGSLSIVLHGHLPYVLNHGVYPHGENWLFEAAAETYLPILDMIGAVALNQRVAGLTIGLTPVLLEQLAHPRFKEGFVEYLEDRIARAKKDAAEFKRDGKLHFVYLAERWGTWYGERLAHFERIKRDIVGEFAARFREGQIQILTSNATHYYMPLALNDQMLSAQMTVGTETSKKHLGVKPRGHVAARVRVPPAVGLVDAERPVRQRALPRRRGELHRRRGRHALLRRVAHGHQRRHVMGTHEHGVYQVQNDTIAYWDKNKGWKEPLEPVGVVSWHRPPDVFAFARHPKVSEQVWSGSIGYPGDGSYLEFHRKYGEHGLRYHKVTSTKTSLSDKDPYYPDDIPGKTFAHAQHFANVVKETRSATTATAPAGAATVVASFDAELFGHWWFEGPQFLRDVVLTLANDPDIELLTAEQALDRTARPTR